MRKSCILGVIAAYNCHYVIPMWVNSFLNVGAPVNSQPGLCSHWRPVAYLYWIAVLKPLKNICLVKYACKPSVTFISTTGRSKDSTSSNRPCYTTIIPATWRKFIKFSFFFFNFAQSPKNIFYQCDISI